VTFIRRYNGLFDGKILYQGGLTFTNIATAKQVPRNAINICYMDDTGQGLAWATRHEYITLYPGKEHIIERSINPMHNRRKTADEANPEKIISDDSDAPTANIKWYGVGGFEDGQTYRIGISEDATISEWLQGSIWEILGWQILGWKAKPRSEKISYIVRDSCAFLLRRPDTDGSLDWP